MGAERRDIRRMALSAGSRDAVRRALPEIGEAFRTASFPGLPRHGVVLVRRLDLGRIGLGDTRQALALRLDALSFALSPVACRAGVRPPPEAPALAWPDWVEAIAAARIALAQGVADWWVRAALEPGAAGGPTAAVVAALARRAAEGAPQAPARYVLRLLDLGAPALAAADLPAILQRWPDPAPAAAGPAFPVRRPTLAPQDRDAPASAPVPPAAGERARALARALPPARRAALAPLLDRPDLPGEAALWAVRAAVILDRGAAALPELARIIDRKPVPALAPPPPRPRPSAGSPEPAALPAAKPAAPPATAPLARTESTAEAPAQADPAPAAPPDLAPASAPSGGLAVATRAGGFAQIVNLLAAAGIEPMERAAQVSLNLRLAHLFLARAVPADALAALLPEPPEGAPDLPPRLPAFLPDPAALHLAGFRLALRHIEATPGRRALVLARAGLPVAVLDAAALARLRRVLPAGQLVPDRGAPLPRATLGAGLVPGLALLVQRLAVRLAGTGWRRTLRRRGWAEATATHLDLTLDLDEVRIAERRAGLDRNPGWVGWLGRVVTLHFEAFRKPRPAPPSGELR